MTIEKVCTCQSAFQDRVYGKNVRVHNLGFKNPIAKCTVCGHVLQLGSAERKPKNQN
jgi:hypothetical protein